MHQFTQWNLGNVLAALAIGGVAGAAWVYDKWRKERGYVEFSQSDVSPIVPDPKAIVMENEDMQRESEDGKP